MRGPCSSEARTGSGASCIWGRSPDGKRRYLERTIIGTRAEAERQLNRMLVEVDEGRHVERLGEVIGQACDYVLEISNL